MYIRDVDSLVRNSMKNSNNRILDGLDLNQSPYNNNINNSFVPINNNFSNNSNSLNLNLNRSIDRVIRSSALPITTSINVVPQNYSSPSQFVNSRPYLPVNQQQYINNAYSDNSANINTKPYQMTGASIFGTIAQPN